MLGNNRVIKPIKLILENIPSSLKNFLLGIIIDFVAATYAEEIWDTALKILSPYLAFITDVTKKVAEENIPESQTYLVYYFKKLLLPFVVGITGDDHFLNGAMIGTGSAIIVDFKQNNTQENITANLKLIGTLIIGTGIILEWHDLDTR